MIDRTLTVTQGGGPREVTVEEALRHQTYKNAIAGNKPARSEVLRMIAKREKYLAGKERKKKTRVEERMETDPENADKAMLIIGIACPDPRFQGSDFDGERLLLEPWAVQAALSRRRGGQKLTEKDASEIRRCTRDADTLRWPRGSAE